MRDEKASSEHGRRLATMLVQGAGGSSSPTAEQLSQQQQVHTADKLIRIFQRAFFGKQRLVQQ